MEQDDLQADLERRFREGDPEAFETLMQRCQWRLAAYLRRHCFGRVELEDVEANTWMRVWAERLAFNASFFGFVMLQAGRCLADERRKIAKEDGRREATDTLRLASDMPSFEELQVATERSEAMRDCLSSCPDALRQIMLMKFEGMKTGDIALELGMTPNKVSKTIGSGKQAILECMMAKGLIDRVPAK